ncbi:MAG: hypothetical protein OXG79_13140 [Chloroflexi bacterium]|nr:hypothetical protein [Chloroflexota bacterium]
MAPPNPKRQKEARRVLDELFDRPDKVSVIHYSCESFYNRQDGSSPRITSVAVRRLDYGHTASFSIHQTAEIRRIPFDRITDHYDDLEKEMLGRLSAYFDRSMEMTYLHWNMRDSNYGFQAIEHRFRVLHEHGCEPHVVDDKSKVDLSRLLYDIYGADYIAHPRLAVLSHKNDIMPLDFLPGAQEASAFEEKDFAALHMSTLRKVEVIAKIAVRAHDRNLKTDATWWDMRGGRIVASLTWLGEHPLLTVALGIVGVASLVLAMVCMFWP